MALVKKSIGNVGTITLDNPKKHNALSASLISDLIEALEDLVCSGGPSDRVTSAPRCESLVSGTRRWGVHQLNGRDPLTYDDPLRRVVRAIKESSMPVIAMIEGSVWDGACEVVMSCDILVAAEGASFAITPAKLGVLYDIEGTLRFMRSVSLPVIKEILFTAKPICAERAVQVGMINRLVSVDRLEATVAEMAGYILRNSRLVISLLKERLHALAEAHPLNPEAFERIQAVRRRCQ